MDWKNQPTTYKQYSSQTMEILGLSGNTVDLTQLICCKRKTKHGPKIISLIQSKLFTEESKI